MDQLPVHPEAQQNGQTLGSLAGKANFNLIIRIPLDAMDRFD